LIKRAVKEIQKTSSQIKTFVTLSPIPAFRNWLEMQLHLALDPHGKYSRFSPITGRDQLLLDQEIAELCALVSRKADYSTALVEFQSVLQENKWIHDQKFSVILKKILMRLCSSYILLEKKRTFALDPVANFHIRNGASVCQLNWMGDISEKGMSQSYGIMINYLYDLASIETNHEMYTTRGVISLHDKNGDFGWAANEGIANEK
ncbi:hypothetical protein HK100_009083, partial [Physocladia obscura]